MPVDSFDFEGVEIGEWSVMSANTLLVLDF